jgi:hypothetical protein
MKPSAICTAIAHKNRSVFERVRHFFFRPKHRWVEFKLYAQRFIFTTRCCQQCGEEQIRTRRYGWQPLDTPVIPDWEREVINRATPKPGYS